MCDSIFFYCTKLSGADNITKIQSAMQTVTYTLELHTLRFWQYFCDTVTNTSWVEPCAHFFISDIYHLKIMWTVSTILNNGCILISESETSSNFCLFRSLGFQKFSRRKNKYLYTNESFFWSTRSHSNIYGLETHGCIGENLNWTSNLLIV